jgi:hypothetical protein
MEGYKEGIHGQKFALKLRWEKTCKPFEAQYYIQFYNGSGIYLISQDGTGSSNGLSTDWPQ